MGACEGRGENGGDEGPRVLELVHDTIRLEAGVRLHDIDVRRSGSGEFDPATIAARQGDVVRFTARDNGGHAIVFDASSLAPAAHDYLETTGQLRSPPLIEAGAAWVITLEGAPAGAYPFRCATHDVAGRIVVGEAAAGQ